MRTITKAVVAMMLVGALSVPETASAQSFEGHFSCFLPGGGHVMFGVFAASAAALGLAGVATSDDDAWGGVAVGLGVLAMAIAVPTWISWAGDECNGPGWSGVDTFLLSVVAAGGLDIGLGILRWSSAGNSNPRDAWETRRTTSPGFLTSLEW